ncbi:hypothetical protein PoB_001573900 [Plakobranchus ocellatus]|uniref:Transposase n=1 Tax=Plakobranchus ocellatus TaxID=259542 RepID=A0AAV3Z1P1_9GAST|nr:hypothetical protein PoB_001573900 [Plakobranchus ocellatus]
MASSYGHLNAQFYKIVTENKLTLATWSLFHHDNAPVHTARMVTKLLEDYEWSVLEHSRNSPDLAPCDVCVFPKMKEHLCRLQIRVRERHFFMTKEKIRQLDKDSYDIAFDILLRRMQKCIGNGGCYDEQRMRRK